MKKSLLSFFMLILCIGILPTITFAQDAPGTSGGSIGIDGGTITSYTSYVTSPPPNFVLNLKRNNGNGVCEGSAQARLSIKGGFTGWMQLVDIAYLSDGKIIPNVVIGNGIGEWNGVTQSAYMSFCLNSNIPPKNKLIFHFYWSLPGDNNIYQFWIPES